MTIVKISELTSSAGVSSGDLFITAVSGAGGFSTRKATAAQISTYVNSSLDSRITSEESTRSSSDSSLTSRLSSEESARVSADSSIEALLGTGLATAVATLSSNTTLDTSHHVILVDATSAEVTLTLPNATTTSARQYMIKKKDSSSNAVVVSASNSQTIDGQASTSFNTQYEAIMVVSDGSNWFIF